MNAPTNPTGNCRAFDHETGKILRVFSLSYLPLGKLSGVEVELPGKGGLPANRGIDKVELMFSTGRKDVNRREIFAGDIVELISQRNHKKPDRTPRKVVEWNPERGGWNITGRTKVEIVGNVFEVTV